jgi:hypothetical protein
MGRGTGKPRVMAESGKVNETKDFAGETGKANFDKAAAKVDFLKDGVRADLAQWPHAGSISKGFAEMASAAAGGCAA